MGRKQEVAENTRPGDCSQALKTETQEVKTLRNRSSTRINVATLDTIKSTKIEESIGTGKYVNGFKFLVKLHISQL
jgi:hypothetical protein